MALVSVDMDDLRKVVVGGAENQVDLAASVDRLQAQIIEAEANA